MAELTIPDRYKGGLVKLFNLSDKSAEELISAFEVAHPKFFPEDLSVEVISKVQSVAQDDILEILNTILSLFFTGLHHEIPPEKLAEDVVGAAIIESGIEELKVSAEAQERLRKRLVRLFGVETINILAKAIGILQSYENTFSSARVVTDIRPVFGSDPSTAPQAAVIAHTLALNYYHEGENKDFYIALDTTDIEALRKVLDRADLKAEALKSVLEKAGVRYLDPQRRDVK